MEHKNPPADEPKPASGPQPSERQLQVVVHAGPLAGKGFVLTGNTVTFGRDPANDIFWDDSKVSRNHARITRHSDRLILVDLGSTNGTLVNGKPITGEHILQPADIISIGTSVFGVKGFAAPQTVSITQISAGKPQAAPPVPAPSPQAGQPASARPRQKKRRPAAAPPQTERGGLNVWAVVGIVALILLILGMAAATAYFFIQGQGGSTGTSVPTVVITAPSPGRQVSVGQTTTVQATASDPAGVTRMELWVSGVKIAETSSPATQGQPTLTASMAWTPRAPGSYTLEVRATNAQNRVSEPTAITVNAVASQETATPHPTDTPSATPTVGPTTPTLTTLTDLNVRAGPGTFYDLVGLLPGGAQAEIIGVSDTREWWQIRFAPAPDGTGWVTANPEFSTVSGANGIPVVPAPPTPTGTPTPTPTSTTTPTNTPTSTSTPVPSTDTPTPTVTLTPTPEGPLITFDVSPTTIQGGECVRVTWEISGVKEIYYQGQGVGGSGDLTECPVETTVYSMRVVLQNDTELNKEITVEVIEPIVSSGTLTLNLGDSIDFDTGQIPGNDFAWVQDGEFRKFQALDGVSLSPQAILNSLADLSQETCGNATYNEFTYLDGSDAVLNPANELTDGRTACFITNEGRTGKMRFPQFNTGPITVEWLTWK